MDCQAAQGLQLVHGIHCSKASVHILLSAHSCLCCCSTVRRFVTAGADGSPGQRPSVQPSGSGKLRITFKNPEDAQRALDAYPSGPWARLKPFIQSQREGKPVQVIPFLVIMGGQACAGEPIFQSPWEGKPVWVS